MAEDKKQEKSPELRQEQCSYCGQDIMLPIGFLPDDVDIVKAEKYDEATSSFVVIKMIALLACNICHHQMFRDRSKSRRRSRK